MSTNNQLDIRLDMPRAELDAAVAKVPAGGKHRSIGLIALVATLGSFLFGYDTGVISGALPYMYMPFGAHGLEITASEEGWIGGTLLVGAAVGALIGGRLSDRYGRRHNILLLAFTFNALIDNAVGGPQLDVAGNTQGHLQTGTQTWDNVLALQTSQGGPFDPAAWHSFVNALLVDGGNGMAWRVMLMLCTIPAIALWIGMRFMPESPRWYAANRRYYESIGALKQVRDPHRDGDPADEFDEMLVSHRREEGQKKGTFGDIWRTPWLRKLFLVGVFLAICNQTTGVNTVMYYAPKVLQYAGMGTSASITAQTANGIMSVIGCSVALWLIGRFRRRQILITCLFSVFVTLGVIALLFEVTIAPAITEGGRPPSWAPMVILAMMGLFMLVVQAGNGPVVWTMLGEMFPSKVRGIANGTAVFCMWMVNALITATFPTMMEGLGGGITYGIYAVINLVFAFILIKIMPETSNKSLEEIEVYAEARYS